MGTWKLRPDYQLYLPDSYDHTFVSRKAQQQTLETLMARYVSEDKPIEAPIRKKTQVTKISRQNLVVQIAKVRAQYRCEVPDCKYNLFLGKDGHQYVEVHHIDGLGVGGMDVLENVAALCPSHHREVEYGRNGEAINRQLREVREKII